MSSADPRERDDLCGQKLVPELPGEDLAENYDPATWYEAEDGAHFCCRAVWDGGETDRCIWHADVTDKPADKLQSDRAEGPERLDRAVLRESVILDDFSLSECRLVDADFGAGILESVDLSGANLRDAYLREAFLLNANLDGANLRDVDLSLAVLGHADLNSANLRDGHLPYASFKDSDLSDTDLGGAKLTGTDLRHADLNSGNLRSADLRRARLSNADFNGVDIRGATLNGCTLSQTDFEDATFDESTTFGASSGFEIVADVAAANQSRLASRISNRLRALGRLATNPYRLAQAETQYRTVQRLRREHDLKQDPALEIQEKHARRKRALAERCYWDWFKLAIYRWPMGYGEKPWHVVGTSLTVILVSALLYPLAGIRVDGAERTYPAVLADPAGTALETVRVVAESVYFSTVTFTTLGYGDVEPVGWAKALSTVESFLGALLMALLVFVLGRRATW